MEMLFNFLQYNNIIDLTINLLLLLETSLKRIANAGTNYFLQSRK